MFELALDCFLQGVLLAGRELSPAPVASLRGIIFTSLSPVTVQLTPFAVIVCADRARENLDGLALGERRMIY